MKAKNRITVCTLCSLVLLALCLPARADYHYASHEGSNEYPYTSWETAAQLIQDAVDASSPHDTVYIGAGEWYETVATEGDDKPLKYPAMFWRSLVIPLIDYNDLCPFISGYS